MDIVGFMWIGVITGVGGGTLRDLLLDAPVFWIVDPTPLALCLGAAGLVHFSAHLVASRYRFLLYLDAFGMALVTTVGTAKALDMGTGALVAVGMGVITAAVGGILRDILGQEPSILLRRDIYVTAAVLGSVTYVLPMPQACPGRRQPQSPSAPGSDCGPAPSASICSCRSSVSARDACPVSAVRYVGVRTH